MSERKHLWEYGHPYYRSEGNFFASGYDFHKVHTEHDSWQSFVDDGFFDSDPELNLLFRWDWKAWHLEFPEDFPDEQGRSEHHQLQLFFVLQRKANLHSSHVTVTPEDEPAVREWLTRRSAAIRDVWAPFIEVAS